jgi:5,10-methylenetetrahydromethanopterin reductase
VVEIGLSIGVSPREDLRRFVALAARADGSIDQLWVIDSQLAMKDAYVAMTLALWETSEISVGTGVTNLQTRHLSVLANSFATLATIGAGRVVLGLGAGDSAVFPLGLRPSRIADLREAITALRQLLRGETVSWSGGSLKLAFRPDPPPPVFLSASQPRMLELAGEVADGVIVMGVANRDFIAAQLTHVAAGAQRAGRRPEDVAVDVWTTISVGDDPAAAIGDVKSWASAKARWMSGWKDMPASLEHFRGEMDAAARHYDFASHLSVSADHAQTVSDALAATLAVAGDPDLCADRLADIASLGPDRLTLTLLSGGRERRLETLLSDVLPRVRQRLTSGPVPGATVPEAAVPGATVLGTIAAPLD